MLLITDRTRNIHLLSSNDDDDVGWWYPDEDVFHYGDVVFHHGMSFFLRGTLWSKYEK